MSNELDLDTSTTLCLTNPIRRRAAVTVCHLDDREHAAVVLQALGLITVAQGGGYTEFGAEDGVTWSRSRDWMPATAFATIRADHRVSP